MVATYPHDPHVYEQRSDVLMTHGRWAAADTVYERAIALDSLATVAGAGPRAPCAGYGGLARLRSVLGDMPGADSAARRWIALQPDIPLAWSTLSAVLASEGQFDAAISASRRAISLGGADRAPYYQAQLSRVLLIARRYSDLDTLIAHWRADERSQTPSDALDLLAMSQRERGQFRASARTIEHLVAADPTAAPLELVRANSLARVGDIAQAAMILDTMGHHQPIEPAGSPPHSLAGDRARWFCWPHALLADAIAWSADTIRLRALADSIETASARSYYGRDWRLAFHVRGLIDERAHRYADAVRAFEQAQRGSAGWTRTNVELAKSDLALGRTSDALQTLRGAYVAPPDAMGRYVPRSELDYWMAIAFAKAGQRDSASVYAGYVRRAWQNADPEVHRLLATLPAATISASADHRPMMSSMLPSRTRSSA